MLDCVNTNGTYCEERYLSYAPDYMVECAYGFSLTSDCDCQNNYWYDEPCDYIEICEEGKTWDFDFCGCVGFETMDE